MLMAAFDVLKLTEFVIVADDFCHGGRRANLDETSQNPRNQGEDERAWRSSFIPMNRFRLPMLSDWREKIGVTRKRVAFATPFMKAASLRLIDSVVCGVVFRERSIVRTEVGLHCMVARSQSRERLRG